MAAVITKPVFWVIMVAIWALVFPMITGAYNSIYANTIDAAAITSERFERLMPKGTHTSAKDAWEARTAVADEVSLTRVATGGTRPAFSGTTAYKVSEGTNGACKIGELAKKGSGGANTDIGHAAAEFYTPSGNLVTVAGAAAGNTDLDITIDNCKWEKRTPIFGFANGFIRVLLQMLALAAPLGFMLMLAYFGSMLVAMGTGHPIMQVIMTVILVLVGAILLNIALPYISDVFQAIDGNRFVVFDQELGLIAVLLKNFFGVILIAGFIGGAWTIVGQMRNSGATSHASFAGSGM